VTVRIASAAPDPARVVAALPELVAGLPSPLRPVAARMLGLDAELDLVALDGEGGAVVVRVAEPGEELAALGDLVAQCAWLAPRLDDWRRLSPGLGLAPERGARGLLVAPGFGPRARAAAGALPGIALARVLALEWDGRTALALELLSDGEAARSARRPEPPEPARSAPAPSEPGAPAFRSGLRDEDLGLPRRPTRVAPRG